MIDATLASRHALIVSRRNYREDKRQYDGWTLSTMGERPALGSLPPMLRGDMLREYEARRNGANSRFLKREPDALRPNEFEANISRRLGWKAKYGKPSFLYWRHIPIARFEANGPAPHIYISAWHMAGAHGDLRAMQACNPMLDYLCVGVRIHRGGVELHKRHEITPWPKLLRKPALYIPVSGKWDAAPFWTATSFQFCDIRPLAFAGGSEYEAVAPLASPLQDVELAGLI